MNGLRFKVGDHVRFIGQDHPFHNPLCLLVVGHTGVIRRSSNKLGMDWYVEMDDGCFDIDAAESALRKIEPPAEPANLTRDSECEATS